LLNSDILPQHPGWLATLQKTFKRLACARCTRGSRRAAT
jgi:hypothetical protein